MLALAFDQLCHAGWGYPNLSRWRAEPYTMAWRQYDHHAPYTVPLRLELFSRECFLPVQCYQSQAAPPGTWYPVGISWWDFGTDYVALIPPISLDLIRQGHLRLMFYYHEGDNPARIRQRIDQCLTLHSVPPENTILISGNSAADQIPGCVYFDDFECWFATLNKHQPADEPSTTPRSKNFTVLSRTHKWWRAVIMHDLMQDGILDRSLWSYGDQQCGDSWQNNPICCPDREQAVRKFVSEVTRSADDFDQQQHNDHHSVNRNLYYRSYFHVVLETHLDADQSGGTFLTEKTYKCIKYGQPFFIVGPHGSLQTLRDHGYRVFDDVLDNHYDLEKDATDRWQKLRATIANTDQKAKDLFAKCLPDLIHNQRLFAERAKAAVNTLLEKIQ
jgi:hypothetical protein